MPGEDLLNDYYETLCELQKELKTQHSQVEAIAQKATSIVVPDMPVIPFVAIACYIGRRGTEAWERYKETNEGKGYFRDLFQWFGSLFLTAFLVFMAIIEGLLYGETLLFLIIMGLIFAQFTVAIWYNIFSYAAKHTGF